MVKTYIWKDIWFTLVMEASGYMVEGKQKFYHIDWKLYSVVSFGWSKLDEKTGKYETSEAPAYPRKGSISSCDTTESIAEAEWTVDGSTKWDGCSTVDFENGMHLCGPRSVEQFTEALKRVWKTAAEDFGFDYILKELTTLEKRIV